MKTVMKVFAALVIPLVSAFYSCDDSYEFSQINTTKVVVEKGYERYAFLTHRWDSVQRISVTDNMTSVMTIWRTLDENREVEYDSVFNPKFTAYSILHKDKYTVSAELLNPPLTQKYLHRNIDSEGTELDTIYVELKDGQKIWYPVKITNKSVRVGNTDYGFGSLTLIQAAYHGATNQQKSSTATSTVYNTVYKTTLTLQEKYVDNPKTFNVPVYAYATRTVLNNTDDVTVTVKGRNRTPIDSLTEKIRFTEVFTYKSGTVNEVEVSIILKRKFSGENASYPTYDFDYKRAGSNGITNGEETLVKTEGNWTVYGRSDTYSAPFENGIYTDAINSCYKLYHQRAVYKDQYVEVPFGYEATRVIEMETKVKKHSNTSATLYNRINTIYLGFGQDLENNINLYFR